MSNTDVRELTADPRFLKPAVEERKLGANGVIGSESVSGMLKSLLPKDRDIITAQFAYDTEGMSWVDLESRENRKAGEGERNNQKGEYCKIEGIEFMAKAGDGGEDILRFSQESVFDPDNDKYVEMRGNREFRYLPQGGNYRKAEYNQGKYQVLELVWMEPGPEGNLKENVRIFAYERDKE